MNKKSKFQRLFMAILLVIPFILFQGANGESCSSCKGLLDESLETESGTMKVVNYNDSDVIRFSSHHINAKDYEKGSSFTTYFYPNQDDDVQTKKVKAGIYNYGWVAHLKKDQSGTGKIVVPVGGTVTVNIR